MKTFTVKTTSGDFVIPYAREFEHLGQVWVIHRPFLNGKPSTKSWRVSHKGVGYSAGPLSDTMASAKGAFLKIIGERGMTEGSIAEMVKGVV